MNRTLRVVQLNVRKQDIVYESLINDEGTQDATVLAIQEPQARRIKGRVLTIPMSHYKWTKMILSIWREGRWAIRSMLWINGEVEAEQIQVDSPDITAATIRLPDRVILVMSVYIPGIETRVLEEVCRNIRKAVARARQNAGTVVEVVIAGDFNRYDQL